MIWLLLTNIILLVGVVGAFCAITGFFAKRRRVGLDGLAERLALTKTHSEPLERGCLRLNPESLRGLYRGHEVLVERQSRWISGRLKQLEVLHFACDRPDLPNFELIPYSSVSYWVRLMNPRLIRTGDISFDRFFALRAQAPTFALSILDTPIRERLLKTFRDKRARGSIQFFEGEFSYSEPRFQWSPEAIGRFEAMVQRFYELSLAVKIFTKES